jgi:amidophosphoribosyltransferase
MSDFLKHECGIAAVRLRKPLAYYYDRHKTCLWGLNKLFLLMEKQHNRGQDGTGIGCVKLNMPIGQPYVQRRRSIEKDGLAEIFRKEIKNYYKLSRKQVLDIKNPESVKANFDFGGEILIGHLRYGTSGEFDEGSCHPYLRRSNWPTRTLMVMGNFNMTNAVDLNNVLINRGQHPIFGTDTRLCLRKSATTSTKRIPTSTATSAMPACPERKSRRKSPPLSTSRLWSRNPPPHGMVDTPSAE